MLAMLFVAGCRCGLDTSAIDDLECSELEPCPDGLECRDGYCQVPIGGPDGGLDGGTCTQCGPDCVDTDTDPLHCGQCENACGAEQDCVEGSCVCTDGTSTPCGPDCVDTDTDPLHCGRCEDACGADRACVNGTCVCADGTSKQCDDACVQTGSDPANCGDCGVTCSGDQVCSLGSCAEACAGGLDECDGACVDLATNADHCGDCATACDPGESCIRRSCARCGSNADCNDGLDCTADRCSAGVCSSDVVAGQCLIAGVCRAAGERNPDNDCQACRLDVSYLSWSVDLGDGVPCTVDSCVDETVVHEPDDDACPGSQVCALCAGGCAEPPTLTLECDDSGAAAGGPDATCTLGGTGEFPAACYSCSALVGMTSLLLEQFDGCEGDVQGYLEAEEWTVPGDVPICPLEAPLTPNPDVEYALEADDTIWTIERRLNTTDFDHVRLCFDWADHATTANEFLEVSIQTDGQWTSLFRRPKDPADGVDDTWFTECVQLEELILDPSPVGHDNLGLRFFANADSGDKDIYLDRIAVDGWVEGDLEDQILFFEDFAGCADDGLAGWTIEQIGGRAPICPVVPGGGGAEVWDGREAVQADGGTFRLSRAADASEICEDIVLSFEYGASRTDDNELFVLDVDTGGGLAYEWGNEATNQAGAAPLNELATIIRNLSHRDPQARFRSDLAVRFELTSDGNDRHLVLDSIDLRGKTCGPAGDRVDIGPLFVDPDGEGYLFSVGSEMQLTAYPTCTWDGRPAVFARSRAAFLR